MHRTTAELEALTEHIAGSPKDGGPIEMIVRRPEENAREVVETASLDTGVGLVGDNWATRGSPSTPDGSARMDAQLTLMNSRVAQAVAVTTERWPLAGDQIYVDLDLSIANLPAGTRLSIGDAIIEISESPHAGCPKFRERFGAEALRFVNAGVGRELRRRGLNASIVEDGLVRVGDILKKI